ncbi:Rab family GTPase [Acinetobacter haemolyticus]|uniref:Rab family GTPase n=1 Tax=Acinetobacter haemolyticus TaxID=29430 RepID=UPI0002CFF76B|nr:ADP-ribosylation factor-like protein [Acinetobacter haemolyticus]ENW19123.1 hypothetical protein F926_02683 [Acinetobacter haemolyticus NIPH 261]NAR67704.1 hypothetical protein [Acinetobacter haemolyticus]NAR84322.1 hypothetical protein [Acinetobacter haemolyticus]
MPLPPLIIAGIVIAATSSIVVGGYHVVKKNYSGLANKKIAILGLTQSGKTTLLSFLQNGSLPEKFDATLDPKKFKGKIKIEDLNINFEAIDVSGRQFSTWGHALKDADHIFLLVNSYEIINRNKQYNDDINNAITTISNYLESEEAKNEVKVVLISNFSDQLTEYDTGGLEDKLNKNLLVQRMYAELATTVKVRLVSGSLKNPESAQKLVLRAFNELIEQGN